MSNLGHSELARCHFCTLVASIWHTTLVRTSEIKAPPTESISPIVRSIAANRYASAPLPPTQEPLADQLAVPLKPSIAFMRILLSPWISPFIYCDQICCQVQPRGHDLQTSLPGCFHEGTNWMSQETFALLHFLSMISMGVYPLADSAKQS